LRVLALLAMNSVICTCAGKAAAERTSSSPTQVHRKAAGAQKRLLAEAGAWGPGSASLNWELPKGGSLGSFRKSGRSSIKISTRSKAHPHRCLCCHDRLWSSGYKFYSFRSAIPALRVQVIPVLLDYERAFFQKVFASDGRRHQVRCRRLRCKLFSLRRAIPCAVDRSQKSFPAQG
jgi:hypothetical protein